MLLSCVPSRKLMYHFCQPKTETRHFLTLGWKKTGNKSMTRNMISDAGSSFTSWVWLKVESLELRRLHSVLILPYKMLFGLTSIAASDFIWLTNHIHNTRGHAYKLLVNHCRIKCSATFLWKRVIKPWNSLRVAPHDFNSVNSFRICLLINDLREFLAFYLNV